MWQRLARMFQCNENKNTDTTYVCTFSILFLIRFQGLVLAPAPATRSRGMSP